MKGLNWKTLREVGSSLRRQAFAPTTHARLRMAGLAIIAIAFLHNLWPYLALTVDDAGITFAYAKHLVEGHGLVHSVGAEPVEGYSNPTLVLLLSVAHGLGFDIERSAKLILIASGLLVLLLAYRIPAQLRGEEQRLSDLIGPALIASSPEFIAWTPVGLENALFSLLMLAALWRVLAEDAHQERATAEDDDGQGSGGRLRPSSIPLMVAVAWTRPEGLLYVGPLLAFQLFKAIPRKRGRQALRQVAFVLGAVGLLFMLRYIYFAQWLPNTYYAKVREGTGLASVFSLESKGWRYALAYFHRSRDGLLLPFAAVALLGWRRLLHIGCLLALLATGLFFVLYAGGDWMPGHRFMTPLIPLLAIAAAAGCARVGTLTEALTSRASFLHERGPMVAAALALAAAIGAFAVVSGGHIKRLGKVGIHGLDMAKNLTSAIAFENLGRILRLDRPKLLFADLGAPALSTSLRVIDQGALADRSLAHIRDRRQGHEYTFGEVRPDFLAIWGAWRKHRSVAGAPELRDAYVELPRSERFPYGRWGYPAARRDLFVDWTASVRQRREATWPRQLRLEGINLGGAALPAGARLRVELIAVKLSAKLASELHLSLVPASSAATRPVGRSWLARPGDGFFQGRLWKVGEPARLVAHMTLPRVAGSYRLHVSLRRRDKTVIPTAAGAKTVSFPLNVSRQDAFAYARQRIALALATKTPRSQALAALDDALAVLPPPGLRAHGPKGIIRYGRQYGRRGIELLVRGRRGDGRAEDLRRRVRRAKARLAKADCQISQRHLERGDLSRAFTWWRRARGLSPRGSCDNEGALFAALKRRAGEVEGVERFELLRRAVAVQPSATHLRGRLEALRPKLPANRRRRHYAAARAAARRFHQTKAQSALKALLLAWGAVGERGLISELCGEHYRQACQAAAPALMTRLGSL